MRSVLPSREFCDIFLAKITCLPRCITRITTRLAVWKTSWPPACSSGPDDFRLPAYLRFLVHCNSTRPMLVQLFSILQVESFNPAHPLHDEFANRRDSIWQYYSTYNWNLPSEFTSFEEVRPTLRHALEIMDGVQLRWLRGPAIDLCDEWADLEPAIFPSPIWDGYR